MPIFEYICKDCNNEFETIVFGNSNPECPKCESSNVKKLMSACSFKSNSSTPPGEAPRSSASSSACGGCSATSCGSCSSG